MSFLNCPPGFGGCYHWDPCLSWVHTKARSVLETLIRVVVPFGTRTSLPPPAAWIRQDWLIGDAINIQDSRALSF